MADLRKVIPPLFRVIKEESGADWKEMYKVFNMGHRFEIYLPAKLASEIISIAEDFNLDAKIIGHCNWFSGKKLTITDSNGVFEY